MAEFLIYLVAGIGAGALAAGVVILLLSLFKG